MSPRLVRAVLFGVALVLLLPATAFGHAELVESDPADGETITTPNTLTATFSTELGRARSFISVRNTDGVEVARGGVSEDDRTVITVELPDLEPGAYTVQWQALDPTDDHVERDTFEFTVAAPATQTPTPEPTPSERPTRPPSTSATATPAASPSPWPATPSRSPQPSPVNGDGEPTAGTSDVLLALALAGAAIAGIAGYLFARSRR